MSAHFIPSHAVEDAEAEFWLKDEISDKFVEFDVTTEESHFSVRVDKMPGDRRFIVIDDMDDFSRGRNIQFDFTAAQFKELVNALGRIA